MDVHVFKWYNYVTVCTETRHLLIKLIFKIRAKNHVKGSLQRNCNFYTSVIQCLHKTSVCFRVTKLARRGSYNPLRMAMSSFSLVSTELKQDAISGPSVDLKCTDLQLHYSRERVRE